MDSTNKDLSHSIICSHCSFIPRIGQDTVCAEYGNDHSFRNNFEGVKTSIDLISELLPGLLESGAPNLKWSE